MRMYDFKLLADDEQIDVLYEEGSFLGKRYFHGSQVLLYALDSFYVEVFYKQYRRHIDRINCFQSTAQLQPYLEQIDVEDLVKCLT